MNGTSTSIAIDDYLKVIYSHTEWQAEPITPSQLAVRLGLAPSSVTEMVKKLAAAGLVDHRPYSAIRLTAVGEERAVAMVRRHRLIETWLVREFGYAWDEVHDEAEVLEHAISDRLLAGIDDLLGAQRTAVVGLVGRHRFLEAERRLAGAARPEDAHRLFLGDVEAPRLDQMFGAAAVAASSAVITKSS